MPDFQIFNMNKNSGEIGTRYEIRPASPCAIHPSTIFLGVVRPTRISLDLTSNKNGWKCWGMLVIYISVYVVQLTSVPSQAIRVKPDQMQVFNPLLIVTLIPLFEATLYPCLRHYNLNFR